MKNQIVIVGGGITGLVTANYLFERGVTDISIFETQNYLGGVLKDEIINKEFFINSCQYLEVGSKWYKFIPENLRNKILIEFPHTYSSYTECEDKKIFTKDFAGPVFNFKPTFNSAKISHSLENRIMAYPLKTQSFIKKWLKNIDLNIDELSSNSSYGLALRRIYFKNYLQEVFKKKNQKIFDETHGLKRKELKLKSLIAALPANGYNKFFHQFENILKKKKIKIYNKSPIKVEFDNKKIQIYSRGQKVDFDKLIWTGNPTSIIKKVLNKKLNSLNIKNVNFFFKINKNINLNHYVQYFSDVSKISRVFIYSNKYFSKITVETFNHELDMARIRLETLKVLNLLNIKLEENDLEYYGHKDYRTYNIISNSDYEIIKEFYEYNDSLDIINSGWEKYGRDLKFDQIFKSLKLIIK